MEPVVLFPVDPDAFLEQIRDIIKSELRLIAKGERVESSKDDTLKIDEAASVTGYKKSYIYILAKKGTIPFLKLENGALRFSRKELQSWLSAGRPNIHQETIDNLATNYLVNGRN